MFFLLFVGKLLMICIMTVCLLTVWVGCSDGSVEVKSYVTGIHCQSLEAHRSEVPVSQSINQLVTSHAVNHFSLRLWLLMSFSTIFLPNKKYVLWNVGICPIASKVGHVTLATPPLGSFIVLYVVLATAYPTKKKRRVYLHPFKSYGVRGPKI